MLIGGGSQPSFAADEDTGKILFDVKCGRFHSTGRMATKFQGVEDLESTRKAFDAKLFRHFLKGAEERRLIIDYLVRLARKSR